MTVYRRYLPASLACLVTLSAGSAGLAAGGSALDPYSNVSAPKTLPGAKGDKKPSKFNLKPAPLIKQVTEAEQSNRNAQTEEFGAGQTFVQQAGQTRGKQVKEKAVPVAPPKKKPVQVSELDPSYEPAQVQSASKDAGKTPKTTVKTSAAPAGSGDDSVMGGIKAIGHGYSTTFKAATRGIVGSTKAASGAMMNGSKKMGDGIKSSAKASGGVFKKSSGMVGFGFLGGDKKKDAAPAGGAKVASKPAVEAKATPAPQPTPVKAAPKAAPEAPAKVSEAKPAKEEKEGGGLLSKMPKMPKMPKIGIPFVGGKKKDKAVIVDKQAGASETGGLDYEADVAAAPKKAAPAAPKQTPIGELLPESAMAPTDVKPKANKVKDERSKIDGIANVPGGPKKNWSSKLWPFGKKKEDPGMNSGMQGVAGKPHFTVPM